MSDLVDRARIYATEAHQRIGQRRKYNDERYDVHLNDFWYRDMSGFGGGFEDLMLGKA